MEAAVAQEGTRTTAVRSEPAWLRGLSVLSTTLNRAAAAIAAVLLVAMTALILLEICLRFFSRSTFMTDVLVGQGVAAITFLAMAWALEKGSMIRVQVITQRLPLPLQWACEFFTVLSAGGLLVFLMIYEWRALTRDFVRGTTSSTYLPIPLWIPDAIFFAGLVLLFLQIAVRLGRLFVHGVSDEGALVL